VAGFQTFGRGRISAFANSGPLAAGASSQVSSLLSIVYS
jgi:hypothetical protein